MRCHALHALEIGADLGVGPVRVADDLAADDALAVDDIGLGPSLGVVKPGGGLAGVADGDEVDVPADEEAAVSVGVVVDADGEDGQIGPVVVEFD